MDAKCIKFHEFGNPKDVLRLEDKKVEPPKAKEVLVRMLARPINPSDLIPVRGSCALFFLVRDFSCCSLAPCRKPRVGAVISEKKHCV